MSKSRPATSGYARLAQADEDEHLLEDSEDEDAFKGQGPISTSTTRYAPIQPRRHERMQSSDIAPQGSRKQPQRRGRSNSGVDLKAINARLERWADEIAAKFNIRRIKGKTQEEEELEIQHSVFQAPEWIRPVTADTLARDYDGYLNNRMTKPEFEDLIQNVREAIEKGTHPKLISQGSSGSYFARTKDGKVVGVFKPKDEEPYASRNPKWTKWIHRNLFPFFFGRACLIPNLSYVSEAAAFVLDTQLRTNLVPYTDVVSLSSKSFYYDFWDRRAYYRKKKPLPEKLGSFQVFLKGYKDANLLLKEHPWPDQHSSGRRADGMSRKKKRRWAEECRPGLATSDDEDDFSHANGSNANESRRRRIFWTEALQQSFREQLEKLVILDYIMRNTDRGLDNWMIKIDQEGQTVDIIADLPTPNGSEQLSGSNGHAGLVSEAYGRREQMVASSRSTTPANISTIPSISIGAIDNSLSWPWKHPDAWRSYPFGWLFLPVSLIGQPFSEATRRHFLPLLTSKQWWSDTQIALRRCFSQDADFKERMYARQIAVMKGQAWNVVETLKTPDHGPLELTRRPRVCVWDDLVDVPIAVPLRAPSAEMRWRQTAEQGTSFDAQEQGEADIGFARASQSQRAPPQENHDLINLNSPSDFPGENRFNVSRHAGFTDSRDGDENRPAPLSPEGVQAINWDTRNGRESDRGYRPYHRPRMSYDDSRQSRYLKGDHRHRRFSFSTRRGSNNVFLGDDELEGDLGYAAAEDRESRSKKVIVERLETVKSKNPVFTWC